MKTARLLSLVSLLALGACEGPDPVPDKPTWAEDVLPILKGQCLHCHGGGSPVVAAAGRFDLYSKSDFGAFADGLEGPKMFWFKGGDSDQKDVGMDILGRLHGPGLTRMPPLPAKEISSRDEDVLKRWVAMGMPKGTHNPNHPPSARLLSKRPGKSGGVDVLLDVYDRDGDQVLGRVIVGSDPAQPITSVGSTATPLNFPTATKDMKVHIELSDGWKTNIFEL